MASKLLTQARAFLARCRPRPCGYTFDPRQPFGLTTGAFGEPLLNLGADGAYALLRCFGGITGREIDRLFLYSPDRDAFHRWIINFAHTVNGTLPEWPEQRALKGLDERANADLYAFLGVAVRLNGR